MTVQSQSVKNINSYVMGTLVIKGKKLSTCEWEETWKGSRGGYLEEIGWRKGESDLIS